MRPRPTFALSRWSDPDDDLFAAWQRDLDAGRIGVPADRRAANDAASAVHTAAVLAWEAVVLGRGRRNWDTGPG